MVSIALDEKNRRGYQWGMMTQLLQGAIQRLDISQSEAARRSGLSRQRLHQLLHGTHEPRLGELRALIVALDIPPAEVARALVGEP